ncbi:glycoside hydrolase family 92 protein [Prolixibacteraceae bacterium JC049]|nr:glycoside hydrolase family 92 protein [Prolixibacteraceae bacterium JC049]
MKKLIALILIAVGALGCQHKEESWVDAVNLYIGTSGHHVTEYGGTVPGVTRPFGMTQWVPMTRENKISKSAYHYDAPKIIGFIGSHQPAVWMGDYGFVSLMPQIGDVKFEAKERGMDFLHADEVVKPHYYSVKMSKGSDTIQTEMTASIRCGMLRFSFPEGKRASVTIEASRELNYSGFVKIIPEKRRIIGYNSDHHNAHRGRKMGPDLKNFKGYFIIEFDTDFDGSLIYKKKGTEYEQFTLNELKAEQLGVTVAFASQKVSAKVATSFVSFEQAELNMQNEMPDWNFQQLVAQSKEKWNESLSRIKIKGATKDQKTIFYSAMYHSLLYPRIFSEYGKYYSAFDDQIHSGVAYNDYSLWDTFRTLHPLFVFIAPEHVSPMMQSLVNMYKEGGWLPKWPNPTYSNIMIGSHADAIIADAYVKGFRDFDVETAYQAMRKNAMVAPDGDTEKKWGDRAAWTSYEGRAGLTYYKQLGYVPVDKTSESVSRTLEFAYDDFCVAQMAKALGKNDDYKLFYDRSKNYQNLYNPESGFMHARYSDGKFTSNVFDRKNRPFTEGSPWTYLFCAMQDIDGLVQKMGGEEVFTNMLDRNFKEGHYRHDNEPGHHYAYLYNYVGQNHKAQKLIGEILNEKYQNSPVGLCGNDDCGQMSAWYIMSAMGFYTVTPGSDTYALGRPLFPEVELTLDLPNADAGKKFVIRANNLSEKNCYVKSVLLDGKKLKEPFIKHNDFVNGRILVFEMDSIPHNQYLN